CWTRRPPLGSSASKTVWCRATPWPPASGSGQSSASTTSTGYATVDEPTSDGRAGRRGGKGTGMRNGVGALVLVILLAVIVAGSPDLSGQPAAKVGGSMVVASFGGKFAQALDEHYFQPFGREAGVKVTMDPVGAQMVAKLQAQQAAGNVAWSLVMPHDQDTFAIAARGMLLPLPPEIKREALALYGPKIVSDWAI